MNWYKRAQTMIYYRGTRNPTDDPYFGDFIFLSPDKNLAQIYGDNIYEYQIDPSARIINTSNKEDNNLFQKFVQETEKTCYRLIGSRGGVFPFWTAHNDFSQWLEENGVPYDGIYYTENNGSYSLALKNKSKIISKRKIAYQIKNKKIARVSDEDVQKLEMIGEKVVETVEIGNYSLSLIEGPNRFSGEGKIYQVAISYQDMSFISDQYKKRKIQEIPQISMILEQIKNKLNEWIIKYKKLYISSNNDSKTKKYLNILTNILGFNVGIERYFNTDFLVLERLG